MPGSRYGLTSGTNTNGGASGRVGGGPSSGGPSATSLASLPPPKSLASLPSRDVAFPRARAALANVKFAVEYTARSPMRPDLATLKENFTYFASVGPTFTLVTLEVRSCLPTWRHCELPIANLELEVETVTVPVAPAFTKETMSMFSIFERDKTKSVRPSLRE